MLDLDRQLRDYGTYLDDLAAEPIAFVAARASLRRWVAVAATVAALIGGSVVAVAARRGTSHRLTTIGAGSPQPTTATARIVPVPAIVNAHPTFDQQVAQLEKWYKDWPAEAPGGRPILEAEAIFCDTRWQSAGQDGNVQVRFASYFPLGQSLTEARIVDGCSSHDPVAPIETPASALPAHQLCATQRRGPDYDPSAVVTKPVTRAVVVLGDMSCATAGYGAFSNNLLDELNQRRRVEIEIRAVPSSCPTEQEASAWARAIAARAFGRAWPVASLPATAAAKSAVSPTTPPPTATSPRLPGCFRPDQIDWDLHRIALAQFPRLTR